MATSTEELTNCVICTEVFTDPQVLPCEHVFCKGCVNRMKDEGTIKCPNCSKVCVIDDVKPDFRLATFLDALAKTTERLTKLTPPSDNTDDVTQKHAVPPAGDKCESCEENIIDSFCHQCKQWLCTKCRKAHGRLKVSKNHTFTLLSEKSHQLKIDITKNVKLVQQKIKELQINAKSYEAAINKLKTTQKDVMEKSKNMRKSFHEDIDKYFDTIDERIGSFCSTDLNTFTHQNRDVVMKTKACEDLTANMESLIAQNDRKLLSQGEPLLSQAKEFLQSLECQSIDALKIPQVRLERGQDWSFEGAVDLQLLQVQRNFRVCTHLQ